MNKETENTRNHTAWVQEVAFEVNSDFNCNLQCLCGNTGCARHGICKICVQFHKCVVHPTNCKYRKKWKE